MNGVIIGRRGVDAPAFSVDLPATIATGTADLGDVRVPAKRSSATGKVVDAGGNGLEGAWVDVVQKVKGQWRGASDFRQSPLTGDDGSFDIPGSSAQDGLALRAEKSGWLPSEPVPVTAGARDVAIRMVRAGGISGSFASWPFSSRDPSAPITAIIRGPRKGTGADGSVPGALYLPVDNGHFGAPSLVPGTYVFHVGLYGESESAFVVDDLIIKSGEVNSDARLQDIDLKKLLGVRVITVTDEGGRPIARAAVQTRPGTSGATSVTDASGRAVVMSKQPATDLLVCASGYRSSLAAQIAGDATVKLRKAAPIRVTIKLDDMVTLPAAPFTLKATLAWRCGADETPAAVPDTDDARNSREAVAFGADRIASFNVADPGVFQVRLSLTREIRDPTPASQTAWIDGKGSGAPAPERQVRAVEGLENTATINITATEMDAARQRLTRG